MYMEKGKSIIINMVAIVSTNKYKWKCRVLNAGAIKSIYKNTVNTQLLHPSLARG